jgi:hypothetical protein
MNRIPKAVNVVNKLIIIIITSFQGKIGAKLSGLIKIGKSGELPVAGGSLAKAGT